MSSPEKSKKGIRILIAVLVIVFLCVITYFVGKPMVHFASDPDKFRLWVNEKGFPRHSCFYGNGDLSGIHGRYPGRAF